MIKPTGHYRITSDMGCSRRKYYPEKEVVGRHGEVGWVAIQKQCCASMSGSCWWEPYECWTLDEAKEVIWQMQHPGWNARVVVYSTKASDRVVKVGADKHFELDPIR